MESMQYNTSKAHLVLPEYGRNIQQMVDFAVTVKDKEERNKVAQSIITVMGQLNPHLRDITDFKHKLWDHLFIISDYKLDVDSPYPKPTAETFNTKPDKVEYPSRKIKYGHYGRTIERLIEKAVEYKEGDEKSALVKSIANLMKRSYLTWNRDSVTDEVIVKHLEEMSGGQLKLPEGIVLTHTSEILQNKPNNSRRRNHKNDKRGRNHKRNHRK